MSFNIVVYDVNIYIYIYTYNVTQRDGLRKVYSYRDQFMGWTDRKLGFSARQEPLTVSVEVMNVRHYRPTSTSPYSTLLWCLLSTEAVLAEKQATLTGILIRLWVEDGGILDGFSPQTRDFCLLQNTRNISRSRQALYLCYFPGAKAAVLWS